MAAAAVAIAVCTTADGCAPAADAGVAFDVDGTFAAACALVAGASPAFRLCMRAASPGFVALSAVDAVLGAAAAWNEGCAFAVCTVRLCSRAAIAAAPASDAPVAVPCACAVADGAGGLVAAAIWVVLPVPPAPAFPDSAAPGDCPLADCCAAPADGAASHALCGVAASAGTPCVAAVLLECAVVFFRGSDADCAAGHALCGVAAFAGTPCVAAVLSE